MQSVNDDMDDLFRRAAEDYPLNTEGSDWSKVMEGLNASRRTTVPQRIKSLERYFWMAAIFFIVVCTTFIQKTERIIQPGPSFTESDNSYKPEVKKPEGMSTGSPDEKDRSILSQIEKNLVYQKKSSQPFTRPAKTQSPFLIPPKENIAEKETESTVQQPDNLPYPVSIGKDSINEEASTHTDSTELFKKDKEEVTAEAGGPIKSMKKGFAQKLYTTLVMGPDVSTVKSQKINRPGYSIGLLAGFQFNKRLSVESGVLWDHKDYYSTGKHFNKSGLGLPQHAKVLDVDGYCNMFEIPINLKLNWVQRRNYNLFATSGVSSYLMKKEEYDYSYDYYGTQYKYYKQYKNASRNWVSILNLSIGFEKKIGNAGSLRVEPYLKLPLKGVGIGELPIGSKGVFVGFSRPIQ